MSQIIAQSTVHTFMFGGQFRSYRLYVPPTYNGNNAVPLVFNLHGYTSNAFQQEVYSNMNAVADTAGFIVCYPDGINNSWNSGFQLPYNGGIPDDVGFISILIDSISTNYNINPSRVYSCGMSNGGFMSYRLACDLEDRIAAVASVTGSMTTIQLNNCQSTRAVPVLEIHGTNDVTVPYGPNSLAIGIDSLLGFWRSGNNCIDAPILDTLPDLVQEGSTVTTQLYGGCQGNTEVLHYKIQNGGHTWPGSGIQIQGLNTNQDIKASVEIWKFFYRFEHPAPIATQNEAPRAEKGVEIGPNPSEGKLLVKGIESTTKIRVINELGKVVKTARSNSEVKMLDLQNLPNGIYIIETNTDGKIQSKRFVIQH